MRWLVAGLVAALSLGVSAHFLTASTQLHTAYETIAFKTVRGADEGLLDGVEYTKRAGRTGTLQVRTKGQMDERGELRDSRVVWRHEITPAESEVVVYGTRSRADTESDVADIAARYAAAWKKGDYGAVMSLCDPQTLGTWTSAEVEQACGQVGETMIAPPLSAPLVEGMKTVLTADPSASGEQSLSVTAYPPGSVAVALVPGLVRTRSSVLGEQEREGGLRLAYGEQGWRVIYDGPLKVVNVGRKQRHVSSSWGGTETGEVTLETLVVYPDRVALVLKEANLTHSDSGGGSIDSQFSNLGWTDAPVLSDDSGVSRQYTVDTERSSSFWGVGEGQSQRGVIWVVPGLATGVTSLTVTLADVSFPDVDVR